MQVELQKTAPWNCRTGERTGEVELLQGEVDHRGGAVLAAAKDDEVAAGASVAGELLGHGHEPAP